MNSERSGVNTMTIDRKKILVFLAAGLVLIVAACGSDSDSGASADASVEENNEASEPKERDFSNERAQDKEEIRAVFDELLARVKAQDFAVLYDQEFIYLREKYSYDEYLTFRQMRNFDFASVKELNPVEFEFKGEDTCIVMLEALFYEPKDGQESATNPTRLFYHQGRWIKPTISGFGNGPKLQRDWEYKIFQAESAAAAEAAEGL